jgi:hypothetical protein
LTFTKTQHNCSVQTDEKHNQELVKVWQKTRTFLTKKFLLANYEKKVLFSWGWK